MARSMPPPFIKYLSYVILLVSAMVAVNVHHGVAQDGCIIVDYNLLPCFYYLSSGGILPQECCTGVNAVNIMVTDTPSLQATCACWVQVAESVNSTIAAQLPTQCNITMGYEISPQTDCSSLTWSSS
ncbi:hypothetical protein Drorol1_Dr00014069 [Drosera rotundifolia]